MLVQRRSDGLRLITQHDHAIVSGQMAFAWGGEAQGHGAGLRADLVVAIGLHDFPWHAVDASPPWNPATSRPHDFIDYPAEQRLLVYSSGLDRLEKIHAFAAHLVSRHYCAFSGMEAHREFQAMERKRRRRLAERLGERLGDRDAAAADLRLLQFFDLLSLYLCLAPPSAGRDDLPDWLEPRTLPNGGPVRVSWHGDHALVLDPSPWRCDVNLSIPCVDLPAARFTNEDALRESWASAPRRRWKVTVR